MTPRLFLRMARLARRPPGRQQIIVMAVVFAVIASLWGIEALFGWPDWLTPANPRLR